MRDTRASAGGMRSAIERSGYYPGVVADAVAAALGNEPVVSYVVTHDALFDPGMEVRRHMTVLALTPTRLVYSHTDEHPPDDADSRHNLDVVLRRILVLADFLAHKDERNLDKRLDELIEAQRRVVSGARQLVDRLAADSDTTGNMREVREGPESGVVTAASTLPRFGRTPPAFAVC